MCSLYACLVSVFLVYVCSSVLVYAEFSEMSQRWVLYPPPIGMLKKAIFLQCEFKERKDLAPEAPKEVHGLV